MLSGKHAKQGTVRDNDVYIATNAYWDRLTFELPPIPKSKRWHLAVDTFRNAPDDIFEFGNEPNLRRRKDIIVEPRSVVVLVVK